MYLHVRMSPPLWDNGSPDRLTVVGDRRCPVSGWTGLAVSSRVGVGGFRYGRTVLMWVQSVTSRVDILRLAYNVRTLGA